MAKRKAIGLGLPLWLAACGGTSGSPPPRPDAAETPPQPDAMEQNFCTAIEAAYGDLGEQTGTALLRPADEDMPDGLQVLALQMPLNEEPSPDVLFLELWQGDPPFVDGFAPASLTLNGDQADLVLCGACAFIAADYTGGLIDFNMAYTGELVLDAVDATPDTGQVVGSLSGIKFHEVTIDQAGQHVVEEGCKSELDKISFDFGVAQTPAP